MKKTIVAIAVSSAALASVSAYAEDSSASIYGNIQYSYVTSDDDGDQFKDNGSSLGVKGETQINEDLTAFFDYKIKFDADEKSSDTSIAMDQAFVGLKGGFGTVKVGSYDSIYSDAIQDSIDQMEEMGFSNASTTAEGDTIAYFSPSIAGFELQVSAQVKGSGDDEVESNTIDSGTASTTVLKYSTDALTVAVGYDSLENTIGASDTYGLNVAYQLTDSMNVSAKYEQNRDVNTLYGVGARYGYGVGDIYGSYQKVNSDDSSVDDYSEYALGVSYDLASNMYVYVEAGKTFNSNTSDTDAQSAVGVYYGF